MRSADLLVRYYSHIIVQVLKISHSHYPVPTYPFCHIIHIPIQSPYAMYPPFYPHISLIPPQYPPFPYLYISIPIPIPLSPYSHSHIPIPSISSEAATGIVKKRGRGNLKGNYYTHHPHPRSHYFEAMSHVHFTTCCMLGSPHTWNMVTAPYYNRRGTMIFSRGPGGTAPQKLVNFCYLTCRNR